MRGMKERSSAKPSTSAGTSVGERKKPFTSALPLNRYLLSAYAAGMPSSIATTVPIRGTDSEVTLDGDSLVDDFDGTWLSIDGAPVAYYYLNTIEEGDNYVISGYVPAILNGERVNLILNFDSERPEGYIAGALKVYSETETGQQSKELIAIGKGDQVQFVCDYYDYSGKYTDNYLLGKAITLGDTAEIANKAIEDGKDKCKATYCFTDLYQKRYWTPVVE